jgi:hypothetical protein
MDQLAARLDREDEGSVHEEEGAFEATVLNYYQQRFTADLSAVEVRKALFDNGSSLSVDLLSLTTSWNTPSGERRTRPIEAFSSGERAFAYTRLQLEALAYESATNKVAFLDEFGAYVANDRLDDLTAFIRERAIGNVVDQVVVILPHTGRRVPEGSYSQGDKYFVEPLRSADVGDET